MREFGMGLIYFFIHTNLMEDVTMKTKILVCLMLASLLAVWGCSNDPKLNSPNLEPESKGETSLQKTGISGKQQLYPQLVKIAKNLAEKRGSIATVLPERVRQRKGEAHIDKISAQIALDKSLPTSFVGKDGRIFHVTFALAKHSPVENIAGNLHVAVDPDDYPTDEAGKLTVYHLGNDGNIVSESVAVEAYNQNPSFPLLLVNTDEEVPPQSQLKLSSDGTPGSYLSVSKIVLKRENDAAGYDEFEIYVREENISVTVPDYCSGYDVGQLMQVGKTTSLIFDGNSTTKDAADRVRTWPDVNKDETYVMPQPIALFRLNGQKRGLTPIEDDHEKGVHHNYDNDPCLGQLRWQNVYAYRHDLGHKQNDLLKFNVVESTDYGWDKDDIYTYSGIFGVTENNYHQTSSKLYDNDDMDLYLFREEYPPPPPVPDAPVISGSFSNGHPKISWSAVTYADSYKVFRAVGSSTGSYTQIATTGSTNYVDTDLDQYDHGTKTYVYYKVKAYNNTSGNSGYSNIIQFTVNEFLF